ncbi:MAG: iron-containing alcohol dehydrogenase family protein [Planctomycetota bacterium]|jgi:alcohol dehydrogenase
MNSAPLPIPEALAQSPIRLVFRRDGLDTIGSEVCRLGAGRVLLVTDPGLEAAGHVSRAVECLKENHVEVLVFDGVEENPTTSHVAAGVAFARSFTPELIVGLGGGSSMDCAKGINLILTNGGEVSEYWGINKAKKRLLPLLAVPTTAGTGSEAQSFALISDSRTHVKMACGDRRLPVDGGLRPHVAILDPTLTTTLPTPIAATVGMDAIAHAVETAATSSRGKVSSDYSAMAWERLMSAFDEIVSGSAGCDARADMLIGAHLAGAAIEESMLGAAHACANPLTAKFGVTHGVAVGVMMPSVIRFNSARKRDAYALLARSGEELADLIEDKLQRAKMPITLSMLECADALSRMLVDLAANAAEQWTAQFNPVPITSADCHEIYRMAMGR